MRRVIRCSCTMATFPRRCARDASNAAADMVRDLPHPGTSCAVRAVGDSFVACHRRCDCPGSCVEALSRCCPPGPLERLALQSADFSRCSTISRCSMDVMPMGIHHRDARSPGITAGYRRFESARKAVPSGRQPSCRGHFRCLARDSIQQAFRTARELLRALGPDVLEVPKARYVVYRRGRRNFASLAPQQNGVLVWIGPAH